MVSREDREGRREEGKEDRNTAMQGKQRTRNIIEFRIKTPFACPSISMPVYLFLYLSVLAPCISYLLREGMLAFSETSSEISFAVTVGGELMNVFTKRYHLLHLSLSKDTCAWANKHIYTQIWTRTQQMRNEHNTHSLHRWKPYWKHVQVVAKIHKRYPQRAVIIIK